MATMSIVSTWASPTASLSLLTGSTTTTAATRRSTSSLSVTATARSGLLHCSFTPSSSLSFPSSFSGLSLGLDLNSNVGVRRDKSRGLVVTAAGKAALCLTKRNKSRKSLARTHGFRRRMKTTSGRAIIKRRRAKGRKILCTKTNPNRGK